jgi:uncharacterized membrane protein
MKTIILRTVFFITIILIPVVGLAQPNPGDQSIGGGGGFSNGGYTGPGSGPVGGTGCPIDGGFGILLTLVAGYGAIKIYKASKKKREDYA